MSKYLISDNILQDTADSLRAKLDIESKIKPSEFASKINDIVTNTGAFQVETVEEMNALTKMKVGDYCVVKGVPTYVMPGQDEEVTFSRFSGEPIDLLNGVYDNCLFIFSLEDLYSNNLLSTNHVVSGATGCRTYKDIIPRNNDSYTFNIYNYKHLVFRRQILKDEHPYFVDLNNYTFKSMTSSSSWVQKIYKDNVTGNYLSNITKTTSNNRYKLYCYYNNANSTLGSSNGISKDGYQGNLMNFGGSWSNYNIYYYRLQSTTVDHLVYQYRENSGWVDVTDDILVPQTNITPTTSSQTPRIPDGYRGFKNITVNAIQTETKTTTPTAVQQVITPASGKYLSQVTVNATPLETITITATTEQQTITPTQGKVGISQITVNPVASSVDPNIVAENIKKGVTILGITGTYEGIVPKDEYDYQLNTAKEIAGIEGGDN